MPRASGRQMARLQGRLRTADTAVEDALRDCRDAVDREAELLEDRPGRRARAVVIEPDDGAVGTDPAIPAEGDAGLDRNPSADVRRQDGVSVGLVLGLEALPAGQGHDPGRDPVPLEGLRGAEGELELRSG